MLVMLQRLLARIQAALFTLPKRRDWLFTLGMVVLFALVYLPIGFGTGFVQIKPQTAWGTIAAVIFRAFWMPGLSEEFLFRVLPIPHPTEQMRRSRLLFWVVLSWVCFLLYHLLPWTPLFFREPAFLIGAGLLGIACTVSYLQSGSFWTAVGIHWAIVVGWLLLGGGLERFQG